MKDRIYGKSKGRAEKEKEITYDIKQKKVQGHSSGNTMSGSGAICHIGPFFLTFPDE